MALSTEQKEETSIQKFDKLLESITEFNNECLFMFEGIAEIRKGDIPDPEFVAIQRCFLFANDINSALIDFLAEAHGIELSDNNNNKK